MTTMSLNKELLAPCGLYCGVCGIYTAHQNQDAKLKSKLAALYSMNTDDIHCQGCLSAEPFGYCTVCVIKSCTREKNYEGCYQCSDFPCSRILDFPFEAAKNEMLRAVPQWQELGTERWVEAEESRHRCPHCGTPFFRGARRCRQCKENVRAD